MALHPTVGFFETTVLSQWNAYTCMYIYIYIHIYIYIFVYALCIYIQIYMYIYIYVCISMCVFIYSISFLQKYSGSWHKWSGSCSFNNDEPPSLWWHLWGGRWKSAHVFMINYILWHKWSGSSWIMTEAISEVGTISMSRVESAYQYINIYIYIHVYICIYTYI